MKPWGQTTEAVYRALDLEAHELLRDIPVHDVWRVHLPGVGRRCTMEEVRETARALARSRSRGVIVPALFVVRRLLGAVFGWDRAPEARGESRVVARLSPVQRAASLVPTGTEEGPFRVVYVSAREAVSETHNATVEAYLVWAIEPVEGGHDLLWAVHTLSTGRWTRPYLALIAPFRRIIVYPSLLRRLHEQWVAES